MGYWKMTWILCEDPKKSLKRDKKKTYLFKHPVVSPDKMLSHNADT